MSWFDFVYLYKLLDKWYNIRRLNKKKRDGDSRSEKLVRFDWAMKKLLRSKANFGIFEGFLSELLREDIKIVNILESEGYKVN